MGLGTAIHAGIAAVGLDQPCGGCTGRAEALDRAGDWVLDRWRGLAGSGRKSILVRCFHGLGDAVVASVIVRHLAQWHDVDTLAIPGHASAFLGSARRCYSTDETPRGQYAETIDLALPEPTRCHAIHPATKAEAALLALGIEPQPELCRAVLTPRPIDLVRARECLERLGAGQQVAMLHYQGHSGRAAKDLSEGTIRAVCRRLRDEGLTPVVLDHGRQSAVCDEGLAVRLDGDDPVWTDPVSGWHGLDAATIGALGLAAAVCLGIDSGPAHCWSAAGARTLVAWPVAALHPIHYFHPATNTVHWLCGEHVQALRGGVEPGLSYFLSTYRYVWGQGAPADELPDLLVRLARDEDVAQPIAAHEIVPWRGCWTPRRYTSAADYRLTDLTVGIPHYSRRDLLPLCLRGLANSSARPARVIIVNNGPQPLEPTCWPTPLTSIEIIEPGRNVGVAAAWNLICRAAEGGPVVLVNDDWIVGPETLADLLACSADVATVRTGDEQASWSCVRLAAGVYERIGPFDERFWPAMYEDYDYAERCHLAGLTMAAVRCWDSVHALHATRETLPADDPLRARLDAADKVFRLKWGYGPDEARFKRPAEPLAV